MSTGPDRDPWVMIGAVLFGGDVAICEVFVLAQRNNFIQPVIAAFARVTAILKDD